MGFDINNFGEITNAAEQQTNSEHPIAFHHVLGEMHNEHQIKRHPEVMDAQMKEILTQMDVIMKPLLAIFANLPEEIRKDVILGASMCSGPAYDMLRNFNNSGY